MERRDEVGFTVIELLVVIVSLGILAAVVVFSVRGIGDKGQGAAFSIDARTVRTAEEAYCGKYGSYGTEAELVTKGFLTQQSPYTDIALSSGGSCGTGAQSKFSLS